MDRPDSSLPELLWAPNNAGSTRIDSFRKLINERHNLKLDSYNDLWQWSVQEYPKFWEEFLHFSKIKYSQPYTKVWLSLHIRNV
jgi:acetoacetyl-CoA synthetase